MGQATSAWYAVGVPEHLVPKIRQGPNGTRILTIRTADDQVMDLKASQNLTGTDGKVWMKAEKWDWVQGLVNDKEYTRAKRHAVGETAWGTFVLAGYTPEEADILASGEFLEFKEGQLAANKAITLDYLKKEGLDLAIKNHGGESMVMLGAVVSLFPGYGTIIGGVLIIGGSALTAAEKHELVKRAAYKKKKELIAARTAFIKGEITEEQYLAVQRRILEEAGTELAATEGENLLPLLVPDPAYAPNVGVEGDPGILARLKSFGKVIVANPVLGLAVAGIGILGGYATWAVYEEVAAWRRS